MSLRFMARGSIRPGRFSTRFLAINLSKFGTPPLCSSAQEKMAQAHKVSLRASVIPKNNNLSLLKSTPQYSGFFNFSSTFFPNTHPNTQFPPPFLCLVLNPVATEAQRVTLFKKGEAT
ncbi:hypothetical protein PSH76_04570 [Pseudomonas sp. FP215]|nr:hypothetical protein [Pseudomonas sp. FP215]WLH25134.1 hypothetical protein PSH76_04570 [Pseudomonas sp. FP215]